MTDSYAIAADLVLVFHFAIVVFVVGGLLVVPLGNAAGWCWVNRWSFRLAHAVAIVFITAQAWLGQHCPLTHLEQWLRTQVGQSAQYGESFIQHWIERLMYVQAPLWVLALAYTVFALLVGAAWWRYPPGASRPAQAAGGAAQ